MGRKRTPGLYKRGNTWYIDKQTCGIRISESCGTDSLEEAEKYLARRLEMIRQAKIYGVRPKRTFSEAAAKFVLEKQHKKSLEDDIGRLKLLDKMIGHLALESVHMGTLEPYIHARRQSGIKSRTINHGLQKIKLLPEPDLRKAYPLDWEEQDKLFAKLPLHLRRMALFAVNTGCRDQEICRLSWHWEVKIPDVGSVFLIPGRYTKNGEDRLVVLNKYAHQVIEETRHMHAEFVFTYRGRPVMHMLNNGWKRAREKAGLAYIRVHDLKHTFGRRLRAAGVSFEDRQDLLGHKSGRITTHYSVAELTNLIEAANKVCDRKNGVPLTLIKHCDQLGSVKIPQRGFEGNKGDIESCLERLVL